MKAQESLSDPFTAQAPTSFWLKWDQINLASSQTEFLFLGLAKPSLNVSHSAWQLLSLSLNLCVWKHLRAPETQHFNTDEARSNKKACALLLNALSIHDFIIIIIMRYGYGLIHTHLGVNDIEPNDTDFQIYMERVGLLNLFTVVIKIKLSYLSLSKAGLPKLWVI